MTTTSWVGTVYLDGRPGYPCEIHVERHVEMVTTASPKANHRWTFTDAAGHFHAYDQSTDATDHYPTLVRRIEVVPCSHADHDEDCDGANIIHYHCRICDEQIEPGLIPGLHTEPLYGLTFWTAKVGLPTDDAFALPATVSLRAEFSSHHAFGIAHVVATNATADCATVDLVGDGPLGRTYARQVPLDLDSAPSNPTFGARTWTVTP